MAVPNVSRFSPPPCLPQLCRPLHGFLKIARTVLSRLIFAAGLFPSPRAPGIVSRRQARVDAVKTMVPKRLECMSRGLAKAGGARRAREGWRLARRGRRGNCGTPLRREWDFSVIEKELT